jgi:hypothetical protein
MDNATQTSYGGTCESCPHLFNSHIFLKLSRLSLKIMINSTINLQKQKTLNPSQRAGGPHTINNHKLKMKLEVGFAKMLQDSIPLFS